MVGMWLMLEGGEMGRRVERREMVRRRKVRRAMVRGTVGRFGMLCDELVLTLSKLEMEMLDKLARGRGCPYRSSVMKVIVLRDYV